MVPGPVIHVREGDRITFTMKNRSDEMVQINEPITELMGEAAQAGRSLEFGYQFSSDDNTASPYLNQIQNNNYMNSTPATTPMPHSMDFHARTVAHGDNARTLAPGECRPSAL